MKVIRKSKHILFLIVKLILFILLFLFIDYKASIYDCHIFGVVKKKFLFESILTKFPNSYYSLYSMDGYPIICCDTHSSFPISISKSQELNHDSEIIFPKNILKIAEYRHSLIVLVKCLNHSFKIIVINEYLGDSIIGNYDILSVKEFKSLKWKVSWVNLSENYFIKIWKVFGVIYLCIGIIYFIMVSTPRNNRNRTV